MQQDLLIGKQLGAYHIQHKLGEGGMAIVYKAYHARLRRDVAIKVILSEIAEQGDFQARFEREAQLIASLEHPNIVAVFDFGELDNLTYLVMQYVGGGTLRNQLHNGRPIEPRRAANYMLQMARALHHAHQRGIVHRDVKPQNMLVSTSDPNHLLLSDFGIAKLFDGSADVTYRRGMPSGNASNDPSLTSADQIVGTAQYMAPEQVKREAVDARTDVYALGVVLFQMLTGELPFDATTSTALMYQHVYTPPKVVRMVNPNVPEMLARITARALEKAPEARFQSAEEMAKALEAFITPSTNQLSVSQLENHTTQWNPSAPLAPSSGRFPVNTPPPYSQPSAPDYAQPSSYQQQGSPYTTGASPFRPAAASSMSQSMAPNTMPSAPIITQLPTKPRTLRIGRTQSMITIALVAIVIAFAVFKLLPTASGGGTSTSPGTTAAIQPFTESFVNNDRNWLNGQVGGLTANVDTQNKQYTLTVSDGNSYFPTPANVGKLPATFTLTLAIKQTTGNSTAPYGLAFYMTYDGNTMKSGYAFVIYGNSNYALLRYDNSKDTVLWSVQQFKAIHTGLNQSNELTATVKDSTFSFSINGTPVTNANNKPSFTDTAYTKGNLGLMVGGTNVTFAATKVQLAF